VITSSARWCVLIPCLNEEEAIQSVVQSVLALGAKVIVVDDGSNDRTPEIVAAMPVTLLRHAQRRGKGEALRCGFREALRQGFDAVLTMDGDGQHLAADIPRIVAAAAGHPEHIVIGARLLDRDQQPKQWPTGAFPGPAHSRWRIPRAASAGIRAVRWNWSTCRPNISCSKRRS
jgi:glycosyltransferase involved in cell wall biosynthesis